MHVELREAVPDDRPVLENLLSLYLHDFSEIVGGSPRPDGRYVYDRLDRFFDESHRSPLLIRADGSLAGFALISLGSVISLDPSVRDVSEFFVVRGLRRQGLGRAAASAVFRMFPGAWEVRVMERNKGACQFWSSTIAFHTDKQFEQRPWHSAAGEPWRVFAFSQAPE